MNRDDALSCAADYIFDEMYVPHTLSPSCYIMAKALFKAFYVAHGEAPKVFVVRDFINQLTGVKTDE